jgi:ketosteroid isomerase-like protein
MTDEDSILAANTAYYNAFAKADIVGMSAIWADDDVSCIHPGWPVLIGRENVMRSYAEIFSNPVQEPVEHQKHRTIVSVDDGRVFCVEIVGGMPLAATNWFKRINGAWRLIHHQASPIAVVIEENDIRPSSSRLN